MLWLFCIQNSKSKEVDSKKRMCRQTGQTDKLALLFERSVKPDIPDPKPIQTNEIKVNWDHKEWNIYKSAYSWKGNTWLCASNVRWVSARSWSAGREESALFNSSSRLGIGMTLKCITVQFNSIRLWYLPSHSAQICSAKSLRSIIILL